MSYYSQLLNLTASWEPPKFVAGWSEVWVAWGSSNLQLKTTVRAVLLGTVSLNLESDANSRWFTSELNYNILQHTRQTFHIQGVMYVSVDPLRSTDNQSLLRKSSQPHRLLSPRTRNRFLIYWAFSKYHYLGLFFFFWHFLRNR